jgi:hypothetical protein
LAEVSQFSTGTIQGGQERSPLTPASGGVFSGTAWDCDVRGNVITDPQFFPSLGNGRDVVGEEVRGGVYLASVRNLRLTGNLTTSGPAGTRQPVVFGPHVDRASIKISE